MSDNFCYNNKVGSATQSPHQGFKKCCFKKSLTTFANCNVGAAQHHQGLCGGGGKSATEAFQLLQQGFGELAFSQSRTFAFHKTSSIKAVRASRMTTSASFTKETVWTVDNIAKVEALIKEDRRTTMHESWLRRLVFFCKPSISILHDYLGLSMKVARWVLHLSVCRA